MQHICSPATVEMNQRYMLHFWIDDRVLERDNHFKSKFYDLPIHEKPAKTYSILQ